MSFTRIRQDGNLQHRHHYEVEKGDWQDVERTGTERIWNGDGDGKKAQETSSTSLGPLVCFFNCFILLTKFLDYLRRVLQSTSTTVTSPANHNHNDKPDETTTTNPTQPQSHQPNGAVTRTTNQTTASKKGT